MFSAVRHSSIKQTLGHYYLKHYEKVFGQGEVNQRCILTICSQSMLNPPPPDFSINFLCVQKLKGDLCKQERN